MARTTFSGPVRAGYRGGDASPNQPLTPTTVNAGQVIEVDQGTGAYGFYSRLSPLLGLVLAPFKSLVKLMACLDEFKLASRLQQSLRPISTTWLVSLVTLR
jgi:hypothetical protein